MAEAFKGLQSELNTTYVLMTRPTKLVQFFVQLWEYLLVNRDSPVGQVVLEPSGSQWCKVLVPGLVTLGLTQIWTSGLLPMIPHQAETQFFFIQPFPVSFLHLHQPQYYAGVANANTMTWKPWQLQNISSSTSLPDTCNVPDPPRISPLFGDPRLWLVALYFPWKWPHRFILLEIIC